MREQLLNNVLESPDDNLPRLIFADWLEEHGDRPGDQEWSELIRLQIGRGSAEEHKRAAMDKRIRELMVTTPKNYDGIMSFDYIRGFLSSVQLLHVSSLPAILRENPIEDIRIDGIRLYIKKGNFLRAASDDWKVYKWTYDIDLSRYESFPNRNAMVEKVLSWMTSKLRPWYGRGTREPGRELLGVLATAEEIHKRRNSQR